MTLRDLLTPRWVRSLRNRFIRARLARSHDLSFTADYVSAHREVWMTHLGPLLGRADIRALEIGCFEGRSTLWFLQNLLTHPGSRITCVDSFVSRGREARFEHNLRISGLGNQVTTIKDRSDRAMSRLEEQSYDVIYIDGDHRAASVMLDAVQAWLLLRPDGILIFDDYEWDPDKPPEARPQLAIDAFLRAFAAQIELLHKGYQVIVRKSPRTPPTSS